MNLDGCISDRRRSKYGRRLYSIGLLFAIALTGSGAPKPAQTKAAQAKSAQAKSAAKPAPKTALSVSSVRFWTLGDITRVAVEVSGQFHFASARVDEPARVFFDIEGARLGVGGGKASTIPVNDAHLKQIRLAENRVGATRVVLDLEPGMEFTASQLSNPERLMIELRAKGKAAPAPVTSQTAPERPAEAVAEAAAVLAPLPPPLPKMPPVPAQKGSKGAKSGTATATAKNTPPPTAPPPTTTKPDTSGDVTQISTLLVPQVFASIAGGPATGSSVAASVTPAKRGVDLTTPVATPSPDSKLPEPKPAAKNVNGERSLTRVLDLKLKRIVIDPGHGGHDVGTHGKSGTDEKDLVLDVSKKLAALLEERMGIEVILTRTDDTYVSLEERTRLANQSKADLFLSVHANSSPIKSVAGVETFYLNFNAGKDDTDLAMRENASTERSIADLKDAVTKIALRAKLDESREFALRIQSALHTAAVAKNKEARDRGVKRAPFVVLIGADMPSVLAEIGFLSNAKDDELLKGNEHRDRLAEALYKGIAAYADSLSRTTELVTKAK